MEYEFDGYLIKNSTSFSIYKVRYDGTNVNFEFISEEHFELISKMIGNLVTLEEEEGYRNIELLFPILSEEQIEFLYNENYEESKENNKLRMALF